MIKKIVFLSCVSVFTFLPYGLALASSIVMKCDRLIETRSSFYCSTNMPRAIPAGKKLVVTASAKYGRSPVKATVGYTRSTSSGSSYSTSWNFVGSFRDTSSKAPYSAIVAPYAYIKKSDLPSGVKPSLTFRFTAY